jgi:cytochrome c oxidase assembly protein subunit 15
VPRVTYVLALVTAAATLVLIVFGGLVTNTGAGLAVPDWPTTFGYTMFLYPWSKMVGGIFYEHSHRLIGSVVGLLTLALAAACWRVGGLVRHLGLVAVGVVIAQGVLGGLRVVLLQSVLAILHGCLAQAFFGVLTAIAFLTSRAAVRPAPPVDSSLRALTQMAVALVYAQIVFGALLTHAGRLDLHLAGAVLVFVFVPIVTARSRRSGDPVAATGARALLAVLGLQLLLGVGSFLGRFTSVALPGGALTGLTLPVAHRALGSLVLGGALILALRATAVTARPGVRHGFVVPLATASRGTR